MDGGAVYAGLSALMGTRPILNRLPPQHLLLHVAPQLVDNRTGSQVPVLLKIPGHVAQVKLAAHGNQDFQEQVAISFR